MHKLHSGLTVCVEVKPGHATDLKKMLNQFNNGKLTGLDFTQSPTTLFASGIVLKKEKYGKEELPETFVLATTFCGPLTAHLRDIITIGKTGLCQLFSHCEEFQQSASVSDEELLRYIKAHRFSGAFRSRNDGISKKEITKEKELRHEIDKYIDKLQTLIPLPGPIELQLLIQRHIKSLGSDYAWAYKPAKKSLIEKLMPVLKKGLLLLLLLLLGIVFFLLLYFPATRCAGIMLVFLIGVFFLLASSGSNQTAGRPENAWVRKNAATQLHPVINEMTAAAPLKSGFCRRIFYASALHVINLLNDQLMNVPTVRSIRWLSINQHKRLFFHSCYSNTTDFYVRDFLTGDTPKGVNFMFSNGKGFPDTNYFVKGGIKEDPEGYMNAVHTGQQATDFWYAHEPFLTVDIIQKNREIRNGLFKKMTCCETRQWLQLL